MEKYLVTRKNAWDFIVFLAEIGDFAFNNSNAKRSEITKFGMTTKWARDAIREHGKWDVRLAIEDMTHNMLQDILDGREWPTRDTERYAKVWKGCM